MSRFNIRDRLMSFKHAFNGLKLSLWKEHNFRIHLAASVIVIALGIIVEVSKSDWLWLILAIALVLVTEMINTAIERLVDLVEPNHNPLAGKVKDISAGAVLIAAATSLIIGIIVFWPYFCS